jgi:DNA polymerase I-like protein with 3'-5' exonuclease and polymerase domains
MTRNLLILTPFRNDGKAFSIEGKEIFDSVLHYAESICGKWGKVVAIGTTKPKKEIGKYNNYDVLLVGLSHAQLIKKYSSLDLSKVKGYQLYDILVEKDGRRFIGTPPMAAYGFGEKITITKASLLGHLYRHLELLAIGLIGCKNPTAPFEYKLISNVDDWKLFWKKLLAAKIVAIDTETHSLQRIGNTLLTIQFSFDDRMAWVLPISHIETPFSSKQIKFIASKLKWYFERHKAYHIFFNAVFDLHQLVDFLQLQWYNHRIIDLSLAQFNLDENREGRKKGFGYSSQDTWGLERMTFEYGMDLYTRTKLGKADRSRIAAKPLVDVAEYGAVDVIVLQRMLKMQKALAAWRNERIPGQPYQRFVKHLVNVEGIKLNSFCAMERNGLRVDIDYILSLSGTSGIFLEEIKKSQEKFNSLPEVGKANKYLLDNKNVRQGALFGKDQAIIFNSGKIDHRKNLFIDIMKLKVDYTKKGNPSFGKGFKKKFANNKVVEAFRDLEEAKSLYSTFIKAFYVLLRTSPDNKDGRLHTVFRWTILTGRSSSTCVDGATLVLTNFGYKRMDGIKIGDYVWTHKERWRKVCATWDNGIHSLYKIEMQNGTILTCSSTHKILHENKWIKVEKLYDIFRMVGSTTKQHKTSIEIISRNRMYADRNCKQIKNEFAQCSLYSKQLYGDSRKKGTISNTLSKFQTASTQSDVQQEGKITSQLERSNFRSQRLFDNKIERKASISSSCGNGRSFGDKRGTRIFRCASYRRDNNSQRLGQSSIDDCSGASTVSSITNKKASRNEAINREYFNKEDGSNSKFAGYGKIKKIRNTGRVGRVFDISVEEDQSYLACGIFNHNSPNLQNLPTRNKKRAKIVKRQFIADDNNLLIQRDHSAHEIRCWGITARDKALANVFWTGMQTRLKYIAQRAIGNNKIQVWKKLLKAADVHRINYSLLYGIKSIHVTDLQRYGVKAVIFKTLYGASLGTIGQDIIEPIPKRIKEIDDELEKIEAELKEK